MKVKNIIAEKEKRIRDWRIISGVLIVVVVYLVHSLKTTANDITVHVPPSLERGATIKSGDVPKANIYSFSYYLFQMLSSWEKDGSKEGLEAINTYRYYLTDEFKKDLENLHTRRTNAGETKNRSRIVREARQDGYNPSKVIKVSENKWVVKLDILIREKIGETEIKRVAVRYPIIVILDDTSPDNNPWGFKFAGFDSQPRKIVLNGES